MSHRSKMEIYEVFSPESLRHYGHVSAFDLGEARVYAYKIYGPDKVLVPRQEMKPVVPPEPESLPEQRISPLSPTTDRSTWLKMLADNKYMLGKRYSEWIIGSPSLEASVTVAAMSQEEFQQAQQLYMFCHLPLQWQPSEMSYITFLERPFASWIEFVAVNFLFDQALTLLIESVQKTDFEPLAQQIRQQEKIHAMYARSWLRKLASISKSRKILQQAIHRLQPEILNWLKPMEARQQFRQYINPFLREMDIDPEQ